MRKGDSYNAKQEREGREPVSGPVLEGQAPGNAEKAVAEDRLDEG